MTFLRRRPTALVWYSRLRGLALILLLIAVCFYVALFINPQLQNPYNRTFKEPLAVVFIAAIPNAFELRNALHQDIGTFRSRRFLACLITTDLLFSGGLCFSSFLTGSFLVGTPLPSALSWVLLILLVLHIVTMSFVCREENLRRKQAAKQKEIELENRIVDNVEERGMNDLEVRASNTLGGGETGREAWN